MSVDAVITGFYQPYRAARRTGDGKRLAGLFLPEAVLLVPDRPPLRGRAAIGAFFATRAPAGLALDFDRIRLVGGIALVDGIAHWQEGARHVGVSFFDVLRPVGDAWLCEMGGWTSATGFDLAAAA